MPLPQTGLRHLARRALLLACAVLGACSGPEIRFDATPPPMSTAVLIALGLQDEPDAWACIDAAHDRYLAAWRDVARDEARAISDRVRSMTDPFGLGRSSMPDRLKVLEELAKRHGQLVRRLENLDEGLLSDWSACLGASWNDRLDALRVDRSILRWRAIGERGGAVAPDLRLMIPGIELDEASRERLVGEMRRYAQALGPLVRRLAEARLDAPIEHEREIERQRAAGLEPDARDADARNGERQRKAIDAMLALGFSTLDRLNGTLPDASLDRLREAFIDACDRGRPRYGEELLAPIAAELRPIDARTRETIRTAIDAHETADRVLREDFAARARRDPGDPELGRIRERRAEVLKALNARVISLLPEEMQASMERMRRIGPLAIRREMETFLDPAVASRLARTLPDPEPTAPAHRLPVRQGTRTLMMMLPPDFAAWAAIRLPALAEGDPDRAEPIRLLVQDAGERWTREMGQTFDRLEPLTGPINDAVSDASVTLNETQRRLRAAIGEYDAARARLQAIEDETLESAAAVAGIPRDDPRIERMRLERATEFAGLAWRELPVHTLFKLDREATIDLPTVMDGLEVSDGARAMADMTLVDSAVPVIEAAEALRAGCIGALRSLVLDLKRAALRNESKEAVEGEFLRALRSASSIVAVSAEARMTLQRSLVERMAAAMTPQEARTLRRAYWERAFPELFIERRPLDPVIDRLVESLPPQGDLRAAAESLLEAHEVAIDGALPDLVEARRGWANDANRLERGTFEQIERQAPPLGVALRIRDEISARMLRSLASLHGDDPEAWQAVADWARERPFAYEAVSPRPGEPARAK